MIFLGTAAAELIPNPFCECELCKEARSSEDSRNRRRRSALLLDENNLIDIGPDVPQACSEFGISLSQLRNIFVTHAHDDHFSFSSLFGIKTSTTPPPHLRIFMASWTLKRIMNLEAPARLAGFSQIDLFKDIYAKNFDFIGLDPGITYEIDNLKVTPLKTIHQAQFEDEFALNYIFERNGKALLYASDTGIYPEETFRILSKFKIDTLVIEGTRGLGDFPITSGHLTYVSLNIMIDKMKQLGVMNNLTRIFVTHISHKAKMSHSQYDSRLKSDFGQNASVAYDGLEVQNVL